MFRVPTDIKAGRAVTLLGHPFVKDARIPIEHLTVLAQTNALGALLSKGVLYAYPDPHARRTPAGRPTAASLPAVVLKAVLTAEEAQDVGGAITDVVITPGNASLSVAFTLGAAGESAITDIEYSLDGGAWTSGAATASPVAISGLVNGQAYSVRLRSISAVGEGLASAAVSGTPRTTASAPTALVATAGDTTASIAFTAPASNGGAAITGYQYSVDSGAWSTTTPPTTASPCVITGLTNGVEVSVRLRAVNAAGNGTASSAVLVTPAGA